MAELAANAFEVARDARLVLAERLADLREGAVFRVVQTQALQVARVEQTQSDFQRAREQSEATLAVRIGRRLRARNICDSLWSAVRTWLIAVEVREAPSGAQRVDMALREDRAQPSFQGAAPVKIAKQGALTAFALAQPVQLCEQGIREFAGGWRTRRTSQNRPCRRPQIAAICGNKMLPGLGVSFRACAGKRQVLKMQRAEVLLELFGDGSCAAKALTGAALEGQLKAFASQAPRASS